jgi:hypothetical protein
MFASLKRRKTLEQKFLTAAVSIFFFELSNNLCVVLACNFVCFFFYENLKRKTVHQVFPEERFAQFTCQHKIAPLI